MDLKYNETKKKWSMYIYWLIRQLTFIGIQRQLNRSNVLSIMFSWCLNIINEILHICHIISFICQQTLNNRFSDTSRPKNRHLNGFEKVVDILAIEIWCSGIWFRMCLHTFWSIKNFGAKSTKWILIIDWIITCIQTLSHIIGNWL